MEEKTDFKEVMLKIAAWIVIILASVLSFGILSLVFFLSMYTEEANLAKLILFDLGIIIVAVIVFVLGFALFQLLLSFEKVEEETEENKEEIERIERAASGMPEPGRREGNDYPKKKG